MTPRLIQMMTKKGFVSLFWSDLKLLREKKPEITHCEVYEKMEKEYQAEFKQRRYASFKSFLVIRNRRYEKNS